MDLFSSKVRIVGVLSVIIIVIFTFGIFYFIQNITENSVRSSLIKEQVQRQTNINHGNLSTYRFRSKLSNGSS